LFQLDDVLSSDSTIVIYVLINISFPKLNNQTKLFKILKCKVHEYVSQLTSTPMANLFCSCKSRKRQSKFINYEVKF